jgi:signal peptidase I
MTRIFTVQGDSMEQSLSDGDVLIVNRLATGRATVRRGDVVVTRVSGQPGRHFVKRVVALPGECLSLQDGLLLIDDNHFPEPYLNGLPAYLGTGNHSWQIGEDEYFLMGDNRVHSTDSRDYGPVAQEALVGRISRRIWPPARWGTFEYASLMFGL